MLQFSIVNTGPDRRPTDATRKADLWAASKHPMNKFLLSAFTVALTLACNTIPSDAAAQEKTVKSYGAPITADGAMHIAYLMQQMSHTDSLAAKVECEIITSCTVKGCWMDVALPDGQKMKVRFADYGFFVPKTGLEGKRAVLQGYASKETLDVATQRHYAEDAGKSKEEIAKITEPKTSMMFLADGVLITY